MVVAILAAVGVMVIPKLTGRNNEIRAVIRKIAVLNKDLKSRSKLFSATYRLVISMVEEDGRPKHSFWVEKAPGTILNDYDPEHPPSLPDEEAEKEKDEKDKKPKVFTMDTTLTKKPIELPDGMIFESIELSSLKSPVTSGLVYIHYLPNGFADEAAIHLQYDKDLNWTLAVSPLTGKIDIYDENKKLVDIMEQ